MLYCSWDTACHGCNCCFSFWTIFCPFTPNSQKHENFKKIKKNTLRYHHFTQVYQKSWLYAILFLRYDMSQMSLLFFILGNFLPFYPPNSSKNENFKTMKKKMWRYHHFTQVYQKSWLYAVLFLRYGIWRMQLLFFILGYFLPFYPLTDQKMKIPKKWNKHPEMSWFYTCLPKIVIRWCTVLEIQCATEGWMDGQADGKSDI